MIMIKSFVDFVDESNDNEDMPTAALLKSLEDLGKGFKDEEDIVKAITALGFERKKSGLERTADYVFVDPTGNEKKYISYDRGYVKYNEKSKSWRGGDVKVIFCILHDVKDRLLLILRRALKTTYLYNDWKKSKKTAKDFIESKRGTLTGRRFGL